jgi:hypothetical protein
MVIFRKKGEKSRKKVKKGKFLKTNFAESTQKQQIPKLKNIKTTGSKFMDVQKPSS